MKDMTVEELRKALIHYKLTADCLYVAINDIKLWCEASTCEICGKKEMTDTDCYDYVKKVLKQLDKIAEVK